MMTKLQQGMSLAELMIAMALGLMLTLGIGTLFIQTRTSFAQDEQVANMQANLRFAMETIMNDVTMAGFWGGLLNPQGVFMDSTLNVATDCGPSGVGWVYNPLPPLAGVNNATPGSAVAAHSCIGITELQAGTDVLSIKRVMGNAIPDNPNLCASTFGGGQTLQNGVVYLAENGVTGMLFLHPASGTFAVGGCVENRQLMPVVYYIRNFSVRADDGIPTLCRKSLQMGATPTMVTECMVEGIEQMQIEYGIDIDGNGVANQYIAAPNALEFTQVASIRVHLLARSRLPQQAYTNDKTYLLGDVTFTPNDSFYRRSATTTIVLRNPSNLRNLSN